MKNKIMILILTLIALQILPSVGFSILIPRTTNILSVRALGALLSKLGVAKIKGIDDNSSLSSVIALGILNKNEFMNECDFENYKVLVNCVFTINFKTPPSGYSSNKILKVKYSLLHDRDVLFPEVINVEYIE